MESPLTIMSELMETEFIDELNADLAMEGDAAQLELADAELTAMVAEFEAALASIDFEAAAAEMEAIAAAAEMPVSEAMAA